MTSPQGSKLQGQSALGSDSTHPTTGLRCLSTPGLSPVWTVRPTLPVPHPRGEGSCGGLKPASPSGLGARLGRLSLCLGSEH